MDNSYFKTITHLFLMRMLHRESLKRQQRALLFEDLTVCVARGLEPLETKVRVNSNKDTQQDQSVSRVMNDIDKGKKV